MGWNNAPSGERVYPLRICLFLCSGQGCYKNVAMLHGDLLSATNLQQMENSKETYMKNGVFLNSVSIEEEYIIRI